MIFIHDDSGIHNTNGMLQIQGSEAEKWNDDQWGIFMTVNKFSTERRSENLEKLQNWYLDIDNAADKKEEILKVINTKLSLAPTYIVETRNGYHLWYAGKDMTLDNYKTVQKGLHKAFTSTGHRADKLSDITRVLRMPGFYHWKDPKNPFKVQIVGYTGRIYTESEMLKAFPYQESVQEPEMRRKSEWDNEACLKALSGKPEVGGDEYDFFNIYNGKRIVVNGKETGCWIDHNGFIGSYDGGGPTIVQWLMWYGHSAYAITKILNRVGVRNE
jgi:hypothetical protein